MTNFPSNGKKLFAEGGHFHDFSHIAWGDGDAQFYAYITGYKESADMLIKRAIDSKDTHILDTTFFPICFLYRQYIELALKEIYLKFSDSNKKKKMRSINTHNLLAIWNKVRSIIINYFPDDDKETLDAVEDYISQFTNEDKGSFAFRYPMTKDLKLIHENERRINIVNLAERMSELASFFSAVSMGMGVMKEYEDEIKAEYEAEMRIIMGDGFAQDMPNLYDDCVEAEEEHYKYLLGNDE